MVCSAFFLVFLVSSTYAATTYNLPLLQETLEIIGGDIFTSVTNMLNGGDFNEITEGKEAEKNSLYEKAEDQPNGIDEDDQEEESLTKNTIVLPEHENVSEAPKVPEEKRPNDTTNTDAPDNATETEDGDQDDDDNTVDDEESTEEDKPDDENKSEGEKSAESKELEDTQEAEETKPEKKEENTGNQGGTGENNEEDEENEDDDDEAKILASAVVNIAAQKIKQKLENLEIMK